MDRARLGSCERTEETTIGTEIYNVSKEALDTTLLPKNREKKQDDATLSPKRKKILDSREEVTSRMKYPAVVRGGQLSNSVRHISSQGHASTSQPAWNERIKHIHSQHQWHYSTDKGEDVGGVHPNARF